MTHKYFWGKPINSDRPVLHVRTITDKRSANFDHAGFLEGRKSLISENDFININQQMIMNKEIVYSQRERNPTNL